MRVRTNAIAGVIATAVFLSLQCSAPARQSSDRFANLIELAAPRAEHALLDDLVGEFALEAHFALPGELPSDWTGTTVNRWTIGGRFLRCEAIHRREKLEVESLRLIGFDPSARRFQSSSFDSLSLSHVDASGTFDRDKRTIAFETETKDPSSGVRTRTTEVLRIVDRDHYVREIWGRGSAGEPLQLVQTSYTRSK
ncbi:MAG: DUF1579 family protein [Planctomycetes bacterium]|nr:DUF1579 family protein [Planctomycetota bacterium]